MIKSQRSMLRIVLSIGSLLFSLGSLFGNSPEQLLQEANAALEAEQPERAIRLYEGIHQAGWTSADMYFNWGNAYLAVDSFPQALLQFERARKWKPNHREATYNLNWLRREMELTEKPPSVFFAGRIWNAVGGIFRPVIWIWLGVIAFWTMAAGVVIWMLGKVGRTRKIAFLLATSLLPLVLLFIFMGYQQTQRLQTSKTAIVMTTSPVFSAPDEGSEPATTLPAGEKIWIEDQIGDLLKVTQGDTVLGWMEARSLERI
jgi:tetratricopeptide (TPR) repeat protein